MILFVAERFYFGFTLVALMAGARPARAPEMMSTTVTLTAIDRSTVGFWMACPMVAFPSISLVATSVRAMPITTPM